MWKLALRSTFDRAWPSGSSGVRRFFVPFQVALSLVLVVFAALLGSTCGAACARMTPDTRREDVYFFITDCQPHPAEGRGALAALPAHDGADASDAGDCLVRAWRRFRRCFDWAMTEKFVTERRWWRKAQPACRR